jgi:hypothetical protein
MAKEHSQTMSYDVFGDLQEWGRVLEQLQKIREEGTLDNHQQGLARLARYPFNWQLRQAGLRAIAELNRPAEEVLRVAVQIMVDENSDLETRTLAGDAVKGVLSNGGCMIGDGARSEAVESIRGLLTKPQPPVLHMSARCWQESVLREAKAITTTQ